MIKCTRCNSELKCVQTFNLLDDKCVVRRRKCINCDTIFYTKEEIVKDCSIIKEGDENVKY